VTSDWLWLPSVLVKPSLVFIIWNSIIIAIILNSALCSVYFWPVIDCGSIICIHCSFVPHSVDVFWYCSHSIRVLTIDIQYSVSYLQYYCWYLLFIPISVLTVVLHSYGDEYSFSTFVICWWYIFWPCCSTMTTFDVEAICSILVIYSFWYNLICSILMPLCYLFSIVLFSLHFVPGVMHLLFLEVTVLLTYICCCSDVIQYWWSLMLLIHWFEGNISWWAFTVWPCWYIALVTPISWYSFYCIIEVATIDSIYYSTIFLFETYYY